jgi:hypothetical protein
MLQDIFLLSGIIFFQFKTAETIITLVEKNKAKKIDLEVDELKNEVHYK